MQELRVALRDVLDLTTNPLLIAPLVLVGPDRARRIPAFRRRIPTGIVWTPGLNRMAAAQALGGAGDALVAVSLAGSLFFNLSTSASRDQVLLYLVINMAPFAILAPFIGPAIDRFGGGHRLIAAGLLALRAAFAAALAFFLFDLTLYFEIEEEELFARLAERAREEHRSDDTEETVRHRLEVFAAQTRPLVDYYQRRGILLRINAVGAIDAISEQIFATLHWHKARAMAAGANRPEWAID